MENIIINGVKFKPYCYKEKIGFDDELSIKAIICLNKQNQLILKDFIYKTSDITIIREGISDEELEMVFGKIVWSQNENEYKCWINLISKDDSKVVYFLDLNQIIFRIF